jgi:hypothetical protein
VFAVSLLGDLRSISTEGYSEYEPIILNYALQLAEIVAGLERQTRMTLEQFEKLPDGLELVQGCK